MTITAQTSKTGPYSGNGTTTVFSYTFEVQDEAHLVVTLADSQGVETVQVLNTNYTVSGVGNANGGQITMSTAPAAGYTLTISRNVPITQEVDLENRRSVAPEVLEDAYDKLTQIAQDLSEQVGRAIKVSVTEGGNPTLSLQGDVEPNTFLGFDASGNLAQLAPASGTFISPNAALVQVDDFTGDGTTVDFTLGGIPLSPNNLFIFLDGVMQDAANYTVSGTTLTFTTAPPLNTNIEVRRLQAVALTGGTTADLVTYSPAGSGAVTRTVQSRLRDFVSVKDFGAVGDGVTDDTAAIQAAADYCEANGAFLYGAPGTYLITSTVTLECSGDLSQMQINADGSSFSPAIQVGPASAANYLFDADLKLPFVTNTAKTGTGWSGFDTSIGVLCANVYQSRITVPSVYNFGVGLKVGGYSVGNVYNTYNIGVLFNNKINLQCKPGDANGWSNQNTFIGGRYGYSSAEGTAVSGVIQIQLRDFDATGPNAPNTNVWLNPSVEGNEPEFHFDIQGFANTIISPRLEMVGGASARINFHAVTTNETTSNNFIGGYKFAVVYTFSGAGTSVNNGYIASRGSDTFDFSGSGYNVRNTSGNSISAPHFQGFPSSVQPLPKDNTATDWTYRIFGEGFAVKATGNTQPRVQMDASGYVFFGTGAAALAGGLRYNATPAAITSNIAFAPDSDNNLTLGTASRRWSEVFAGTGTINTSDANTKTQIEDITDAERRVALALKGKLRKFKFKDAVEAKGDAARIHFGIIAQDVAAAFEAEGLSAEQYGVFCSNTWTEEDGTEVTRLGVRYDELMAFIVAAI